MCYGIHVHFFNSVKTDHSHTPYICLNLDILLYIALHLNRRISMFCERVLLSEPPTGRGRVVRRDEQKYTYPAIIYYLVKQFLVVFTVHY